MAKKKYYAVKVGMTPGIYETWDECEANVKGYPKAEYKGFVTLAEAEAYMEGGDVQISPLFIGQDEVGKGEPFRRIIVVAAYLDGNHDEELTKLSATRDSKNYGLDTDKCVKIGTALTHFKDFSECANGVYENEKLGITYSVYSIDNNYYNELHKQDSKLSADKNNANKDSATKLSANKILAIMHNRAGFNLANHLGKKGIKIRDIVIDNFMGQADYNFGKYVANEKYRLDKSGVNLMFEAKAESKFPAVAVASNIANYIEQLYVNQIRTQFKAKGGDLDSHAFSNGVEDVQYAFDEIARIYGSLDNPDIEEQFKHTIYYENYMATGLVH